MEHIELYEKGLKIIDSCVHQEQFDAALEWIKQTQEIDTNITQSLHTYYTFRKIRTQEDQLKYNMYEDVN